MDMRFYPVFYKEPIANIISNNEVSELAEHYANAPVWAYTPDERQQLRNTIRNVARLERDKMGVAVQYVSGQPYADADDMREDVKHRRLLISTDYNNSPMFGYAVNLDFRVAHDLHHCQTEKCNFNLDGEICASAKMLQYFLHWQVGSRYILGEIVMQVCYLRAFGNFPEQREILAPVWLYERIKRAYFPNL